MKCSMRVLRRWRDQRLDQGATLEGLASTVLGGGGLCHN